MCDDDKNMSYRIYTDDDAGWVMLLFNGARDASDGSASASASHHDVNFARRWSLRRGRREFDGLDNFWPSGEFMGARIVDLAT